MKHSFRRICALILIFSLTLSVSASFLGKPLKEGKMNLSDSMVLTQSVLRNWETGRNFEEIYFTAAPDSQVKPAVVYGTTLYGRSTMEVMEAFPESWGFSVTAGVNGSFFDFDTGIPGGCVITKGVVRSSGNTEAVGFFPDGSAIIGVPELSVYAVGGEKTFNLHVNKLLTRSSGMVLYTRDYDTETRGTLPAYHVVLQPREADLRLGSVITAVVTEIVEDAASCPIPEGGFVLSMALDTDYPVALENFKSAFAVGDERSIVTEIAEAWLDVDSACAGLGLLVQDGVAQEKFTLDSAYRTAARTAVGLKADGTLLFYTVDKGKSSYGLTLPQLAKRMAELGCVTALNLDGGGSTAVRALVPGTKETRTLNTPADGSLRKCANFIFLSRPKTEPTEAVHLFAYPNDALALPGAQIPFSVLAADENYTAVSLPEDVRFYTEDGLMDGNVFFPARAGEAKISLSSEKATGEVTVKILQTPGELQILDETGKSLSALEIRSGEILDLTAKATHGGLPVYCEDSCFVWMCSADLGTIDENGVFAANETYLPIAGEITLTAGENTLSLPVTLLPDNPFPDTEEHWAKAEIRQMYEAGVLQGSLVEGLPLFRPNDAMTRQEFILCLMRFLGAESAEAELPFADRDTIAPWALEAVTTAYATGIVTGALSSDGLLYCNPSNAISRQEAMTILSRMLTEEAPPEEAPTLPEFSDWDAVAPWAREGVERMVLAGVISGMDGALCPTQSVTRAQVAKMLAGMTQEKSAL